MRVIDPGVGAVDLLDANIPDHHEKVELILRVAFSLYLGDCVVGVV